MFLTTSCLLPFFFLPSTSFLIYFPPRPYPVFLWVSRWVMIKGVGTGISLQERVGRDLDRS